MYASPRNSIFLPDICPSPRNFLFSVFFLLVRRLTAFFARDAFTFGGHFLRFSDFRTLFLRNFRFFGIFVHFGAVARRMRFWGGQSDQFSGFSEYFPPFRKKHRFCRFSGENAFSSGLGRKNKARLIYISTQGKGTDRHNAPMVIPNAQMTNFDHFLGIRLKSLTKCLFTGVCLQNRGFARNRWF